MHITLIVGNNGRHDGISPQHPSCAQVVRMPLPMD